MSFYLPETAELHESYPLILNVQTIDAIKLRISLYLLYVSLLFMETSVFLGPHM